MDIDDGGGGVILLGTSRQGLVAVVDIDGYVNIDVAGIVDICFSMDIDDVGVQGLVVDRRVDVDSDGVVNMRLGVDSDDGGVDIDDGGVDRFRYGERSVSEGSGLGGSSSGLGGGSSGLGNVGWVGLYKSGLVDPITSAKAFCMVDFTWWIFGW